MTLNSNSLSVAPQISWTQGDELSLAVSVDADKQYGVQLKTCVSADTTRQW